MKPLVSILIPAYNAQEWIAQTLKSAIEQTWPNKEIIVVDDGSKDRTLEVARQFSDGNVLVATGENQGAAAARNRAYSLSQGDYIQWLDADDLLAPDKIAKQMDALERCGEHRRLLSCAWAPFIFRLSKAQFRPSPLWCDLSPAEWLTRKLGENLHMQTATWLTGRALAEAAGPWDTRLLSDDDGEYFCRVLMASKGTLFVPEARTFYRIMPGSRLSYIGMSERKREALLLSMQLHVEYLRSLEDSPRTRTAALRYLHEWLIHFYPERPDLVDELEKLAETLGGRLEMPRLRWKYDWLRPLFGWPFAKRVQIALPQFKWSLVRRWDEMMWRLSSSSEK
jgi:hypothetical protein